MWIRIFPLTNVFIRRKGRWPLLQSVVLQFSFIVLMQVYWWYKAIPLHCRRLPSTYERSQVFSVSISKHVSSLSTYLASFGWTFTCVWQMSNCLSMGKSFNKHKNVLIWLVNQAQFLADIRWFTKWPPGQVTNAFINNMIFFLFLLPSRK